MSTNAIENIRDKSVSDNPVNRAIAAETASKLMEKLSPEEIERLGTDTRELKKIIEIGKKVSQQELLNTGGCDGTSERCEEERKQWVSGLVL